LSYHYYNSLCFFFHVGKEGTGGSTSAVSSHFGIGKGSVINYVKRCVSALHEIKKEVIHWHDEQEHGKMKARLTTTGFRHCVGILNVQLYLNLDLKYFTNATIPKNHVMSQMSLLHVMTKRE
jgi:hypothetical protein